MIMVVDAATGRGVAQMQVICFRELSIIYVFPVTLIYHRHLVIQAGIAEVLGSPVIRSASVPNDAECLL